MSSSYSSTSSNISSSSASTNQSGTGFIPSISSVNSNSTLVNHFECKDENSSSREIDMKGNPKFGRRDSCDLFECIEFYKRFTEEQACNQIFNPRGQFLILIYI